MEFTKTDMDTKRWIKQQNEDCFFIVEVREDDDNEYIVAEIEVDFNGYQEEYLDYISAKIPYGSLDNLKDAEPNNWGSIYAEIIADDNIDEWDSEEYFESQNEVIDHLEEKYDIEFSF